jgi:isoamylase
MIANFLPGQAYPLGATVQPDGVNFSVFSKNCYTVELLLFDHVDDPRPAAVIPLDPRQNRTFYYWHIFVPGLKAGQLYGYRVDGPFDPAQGYRFDGSKILLDPYCRAVAIDDNYRRAAAMQPGDNCAESMKSVVVDPRAYDWAGDTPLRKPFAHSVIYEMHVGGFTHHPSSGLPPEIRGTYAGLIAKIPYLQALGITAVELLPVQQFDPQDAPPGLPNYWGYSPIAFFAPHRGYCVDKNDPLAPVSEFRAMVRALHRVGIEVILDVVFNHTAEIDHTGPTLSFRGLENRAYYILEDDQIHYANYSGTGNTFNSNHSIARRLIMDCLRYWVEEMHVDGFRFDLASALARDEWGDPLKSPPILWEIESDPILAGTKIIAEAWDAAGLYQVGSFVGHRWAEWNGQFRDDVRRFVKGDNNTVSKLAARIVGSPDLYPQPDREPNRSVNFVTCHDGFTLRDLVSYNQKHNYANGENNRDGADVNFSWNYGEEGDSTDPAILAVRRRQMKNFLTILLISQGTPMLLMGDETGRTQRGNNNPYGQDNETSWFNWDSVDAQAGLLRFVRGMIKCTQACSLFQEERFWTTAIPCDPPLCGASSAEPPHITWHGVELNQPDWSYHSHSLAFSLHDPAHNEHLHVMLNAWWEPLTFKLPPLPPAQQWHRMVDTALEPPHDFNEPTYAPPVGKQQYRLIAESVVVLMAR